MNNDITFNVVEGQLVRYYCDRPETAWDGFELQNMGGGCIAYVYTFADGSYVLLTDNNGIGISALSDDDFVVGLYNIDGEQIELVCAPTIDDALARFGITDQHE